MDECFNLLLMIYYLLLLRCERDFVLATEHTENTEGFLFQRQSIIALNPKLCALLASKLAVGASL